MVFALHLGCSVDRNSERVADSSEEITTEIQTMRTDFQDELKKLREDLYNQLELFNTHFLVLVESIGKIGGSLEDLATLVPQAKKLLDELEKFANGEPGQTSPPAEGLDEDDILGTDR
ncbi:MAG: hypothetical protein H6621_08710 [Halobacteriovoraceae bacterium]|nr:hypothetical protein [Halobacteriovoraceae bacterium]